MVKRVPFKYYYLGSNPKDLIEIIICVNIYIINKKKIYRWFIVNIY